MRKKIRAIQGGTSASKTISVLLILIHLAQKDESPTLTSIVSESVPHLKRGALREFKKIMKEHKYWDPNRWNATDRIYTFESGSEIEFFSADDATKLRGGRRDRLFLNEANNLSFTVFEELEVRTKYFVFLDWNPTVEFWFYTEVWGVRTDVELIILNYKDNEALSPEIINSIEQRKNNKRWWTVYGEGKLGELEEKIYNGWNEVDEIPKDARLIGYGLDFGYTNDPTVIIAIYYCDGRNYLDEVVYRKGLSNKSIADIFEAREKAPVIADSSEPKSIQEIKDYGINIVGAMKGPGSVYQGIQHVQSLPISITKSSIDTLKGYRNYMFHKDRNGKVTNDPDDSVHEWSNPMDAVRYGFGKRMKKKKSTGQKVDQM